MNHPVEEAAHQASKMPLLVAWAGNGFGFLVAHEKELQVIVLVLTILWTLWQWGKSLLQEGRDRSAHQKLLAKLGGIRTRPAPLTYGDAYSTSPTPRFDDTYPNQAHHEGKR